MLVSLKPLIKIKNKKKVGMEAFSGDIYDIHNVDVKSKEGRSVKDDGVRKKPKSKLKKVSIVDKNGRETSRWEKVDRLERLFDIRTKIRQMPKSKQLTHKRLLIGLDSEIIKVLKKRNSNYKPSMFADLLSKIAKL